MWKINTICNHLNHHHYYHTLGVRFYGLEIVIIIAVLRFTTIVYVCESFRWMGILLVGSARDWWLVGLNASAINMQMSKDFAFQWKRCLVLEWKTLGKYEHAIIVRFETETAPSIKMNSWRLLFGELMIIFIKFSLQYFVFKYAI